MTFKSKINCPKCNKELWWVTEQRCVIQIHDVWPEGNDFAYQHREDSDVIDHPESGYYCPECNEMIARELEDLEDLFACDKEELINEKIRDNTKDDFIDEEEDDDESYGTVGRFMAK